MLLLTSLTAFHLGSLWIHQHDVRDAVAELDEARVADRVLSSAAAIAALPVEERDHAAHAASDPGVSLGWSRRAAVEADDQGQGLNIRTRLSGREPSFAEARFAPWPNGGAGVLGSLPLPDGTWLNLAYAPKAAPSRMAGPGNAVASTTFMAVGIVAVAVLLV